MEPMKSASRSDPSSEGAIMVCQQVTCALGIKVLAKVLD
ncbi:hypothetical protein BDA96_10G146800 [Sorghum bicolor]|uniref:Uncharacterized protein n=1 Tax=Sorghum bicolor TaxID=4558 RepID=A0A921Q273_SORBI|nr:hypothetical protein BDA96_10G146800 [Sorghum bicolor]